jgi:hypothetical protein
VWDSYDYTNPRIILKSENRRKTMKVDVEWEKNHE